MLSSRGFVSASVSTCLGALFWACTTGAPPEIAGGRVVSGGAAVEAIGDGACIAVSPDYRHVVYKRLLTPNGTLQFTVLNLEGDAQYGVALSPESEVLVSRHGEPDLATARFSEDGECFQLRRGDEPSMRSMFRSKHAELEPGICPSPLYADPSASGPRFQIRQESRRSAAILDSARGGRVIVRHSLGARLDFSIGIQDLRVSPDLSHLSYVVVIGHGTFAGPRKGYVLDFRSQNAQPLELGSPVFGPLEWLGDSERILGCARDRSGKTQVFLWRTADLQRRKQ